MRGWYADKIMKFNDDKPKRLTMGQNIVTSHNVLSIKVVLVYHPCLLPNHSGNHCYYKFIVEPLQKVINNICDP